MVTSIHKESEPPTDDWIPRHRLTVDEYYRMAEVGLLAPDAQVELIQGEIIDMVPIGTRHAIIVDVLSNSLRKAVDIGAIVRTQGPVRLDRYSEPQPDIALLKPLAGTYAKRHPAPADIFLVVEVSHRTLRYDRGVKLPLYARHGITEVWLIDVQHRHLQRLRLPVNGIYQETRIFTGGEIELPLEPSVSIDITAILAL